MPGKVLLVGEASLELSRGHHIRLLVAAEPHCKAAAAWFPHLSLVIDGEWSHPIPLRKHEARSLDAIQIGGANAGKPFAVLSLPKDEGVSCEEKRSFAAIHEDCWRLKQALRVVRKQEPDVGQQYMCDMLLVPAGSSGELVFSLYQAPLYVLDALTLPCLLAQQLPVFICCSVIFKMLPGVNSSMDHGADMMAQGRKRKSDTAGGDSWDASTVNFNTSSAQAPLRREAHQSVETHSGAVAMLQQVKGYNLYIYGPVQLSSEAATLLAQAGVAYTFKTTLEAQQMTGVERGHEATLALVICSPQSPFLNSHGEEVMSSSTIKVGDQALSFEVIPQVLYELHNQVIVANRKNWGTDKPWAQVTMMPADGRFKLQPFAANVPAQLQVAVNTALKRYEEKRSLGQSLPRNPQHPTPVLAPGKTSDRVAVSRGTSAREASAQPTSSNRHTPMDSAFSSHTATPEHSSHIGSGASRFTASPQTHKPATAPPPFTQTIRPSSSALNGYAMEAHDGFMDTRHPLRKPRDNYPHAPTHTPPIVASVQPSPAFADQTLKRKPAVGTNASEQGRTRPFSATPHDVAAHGNAMIRDCQQLALFLAGVGTEAAASIASARDSALAKVLLLESAAATSASDRAEEARQHAAALRVKDQAHAAVVRQLLLASASAAAEASAASDRRLREQEVALLGNAATQASGLQAEVTAQRLLVTQGLRDLRGSQGATADEVAKLAVLRTQFQAQTQQLDLRGNELVTAQQQVSARDALLASTQAHVHTQVLLLRLRSDELAAAQQQVSARDVMLAAKDVTLAATNAELADLHAQLQAQGLQLEQAIQGNVAGNAIEFSSSDDDE